MGVSHHGAWRKGRVVHLGIAPLRCPDVQTQIAFEPIFAAGGRQGALFWYTVATNAYRDVAIGAMVSRYAEIRDEMPTAASIQFMDAYTVLVLIVWLAADAFITFV